ncbi:hypothetical protein JL722_15006 [Aureococcus anophagefferens]|nr:hypothetical protein JL722_15006 [Aureococcus anophagefferens]
MRVLALALGALRLAAGAYGGPAARRRDPVRAAAARERAVDHRQLDNWDGEDTTEDTEDTEGETYTDTEDTGDETEDTTAADTGDEDHGHDPNPTPRPSFAPTPRPSRTPTPAPTPAVAQDTTAGDTGDEGTTTSDALDDSTLVAHYGFNDQDAADDHDDVNDYDGTIGGATFANGRDGSVALTFDGTDDYVSMPSSLTMTLIERRAPTGTAAGEFALLGYGDATTYVTVSGTDDGEWHHYCNTYDMVDWRLYVDGALVKTQTVVLNTGSANAAPADPTPRPTLSPIPRPSPRPTFPDPTPTPTLRPTPQPTPRPSPRPTYSPAPTPCTDGLRSEEDLTCLGTSSVYDATSECAETLDGIVASNEGWWSSAYSTTDQWVADDGATYELTGVCLLWGKFSTTYYAATNVRVDYATSEVTAPANDQSWTEGSSYKNFDGEADELDDGCFDLDPHVTARSLRLFFAQGVEQAYVSVGEFGVMASKCDPSVSPTTASPSSLPTAPPSPTPSTAAPTTPNPTPYPSTAPTRDTVFFSVALDAETSAYATADESCDAYVSAGVDAIDGAILQNYIEEAAADHGEASSPVKDVTVSCAAATPRPRAASRTFVLDAPSILVANFSTTGDALTCAFDADTDLGGYDVSELFACASILDFDGADDAECYWVDARTLSAGVADAAIVPGDAVAVLDVVLRACDGFRCDCDTATTSSTTAASPVPPLVPIAGGAVQAALAPAALSVKADAGLCATSHELAVTAVDASSGASVTSAITIEVGRSNLVGAVDGGDRVAARRRLPGSPTPHDSTTPTRRVGVASDLRRDCDAALGLGRPWRR